MDSSSKNTVEEVTNDFLLSEVQHLVHPGFFELEWPEGKAEIKDEYLNFLDKKTSSPIITTTKFLQKIHPDDKDAFIKKINNAIARRAKFNIEFQVQDTKKSAKYIQCIGHPIFSSHRKVKIFGTFVDISKSKENEKALVEEKRRTKMILDTSVSMIIVVGNDQKVKLINKKGCEILGFKESDIIGKNWFTNFIPKSQRKNERLAFDKMMSGKLSKVEFFENAVISSTGKTKKWIEWHNSIIKNDEGVPIGVLSSGIDITERKKLEKIRMNAVVEGEERERQRVAHELHDGLMQVLSAISLNLNAIEDELVELPEIKKQAFQNALQLVRSAILDTRDISHRMMPRDLERFGLIDAVISLCDKINQSSKVRIDFQYQGNKVKLEKRIELIVFRIVQELINNILKHSQAKSAQIRFNQKKTRFLISVKDDGVGFDMTGNTFEDSKGIGLQNISTRIRSYNGTMTIKSSKGKGTAIKIMVPLE